jgi:hypothetical protein
LKKKTSIKKEEITLSIKSRKLFAILVVTMMVLSLLPMTAFAASTNTVDKVPQVASDASFEQGAPALSIKEKDTTFDTTGETFRLSLTNAEWLKDTAGTYLIEGWGGAAASFSDGTAVPAIAGVSVNVLTKTLAEVTIVGTAGTDVYDLPLYTKVTSEGEAQVTVDARDSRLSSGTYVFANAASGKTIASIDPVKTFARSVTLGDIQIDETRIGSLGSAAGQNIKLKLPPKFTWDMAVGPVTTAFSGGLTGGGIAITKVDGRTLELSFSPAPATNRTARGSIFLKGLKIRADRDAAYGDVVVDIDGTNVTSQELTIANYQEYTIDVSVKEVKEILAGRHNEKTAKITIKENLTGALVAGREISVVLPEWVKITSVKNPKAEGAVATADIKFADRKNELYIEVSGTSTTTKSKYEFELELSLEADKSGDVVAEIFGAGLEKQELVIATAVAPVTAEVAISDLKIGVQDQPAPDIIITETKKGAIDDYYAAYTGLVAVGPPPVFTTVTSGFALTVSLPDNYDFAGTPTVEVTEGNLEIGKPSVTNNLLTIPIKSSSTKPSTIKISNVKVTLDRTVPEGAFKASIGGTAIVKNNWKDATMTTPVLFDKDNVVKFHFANVITPAPGETRSTTTFTIDSTTYTVVEAGVAVEKTMDVAPYIKNGRTYLPVRFVADALGVNEDNIVWDPVKASVTVFKGDRIAQMTIGSNALMVNGVELTMDAVPEIVDGRTMLPVRWVAQALGANIDWDAETQTVTVKQ